MSGAPGSPGRDDRRLEEAREVVAHRGRGRHRGEVRGTLGARLPSSALPNAAITPAPARISTQAASAISSTWPRSARHRCSRPPPREEAVVGSEASGGHAARQRSHLEQGAPEPPAGESGRAPASPRRNRDSGMHAAAHGSSRPAAAPRWRSAGPGGSARRAARRPFRKAPGSAARPPRDDGVARRRRPPRLAAPHAPGRPTRLDAADVSAASRSERSAVAKPPRPPRSAPRAPPQARPPRLAGTRRAEADEEGLRSHDRPKGEREAGGRVARAASGREPHDGERHRPRGSRLRRAPGAAAPESGRRLEQEPPRPRRALPPSEATLARPAAGAGPRCSNDRRRRAGSRSGDGAAVRRSPHRRAGRLVRRVRPAGHRGPRGRLRVTRRSQARAPRPRPRGRPSRRRSRRRAAGGRPAPRAPPRRRRRAARRYACPPRRRAASPALQRGARGDAHGASAGQRRVQRVRATETVPSGAALTRSPRLSRWGIALRAARSGSLPTAWARAPRGGRPRGKPRRLARERQLPGGEHDQERRGQDAEKLDRRLPAFGFRSLRSRASHPCRPGS